MIEVVRINVYENFATFLSDHYIFRNNFKIKQAIVDGSASKPALLPDTNYIGEKTYHIAPYLSAFRAYLMPQ